LEQGACWHFWIFELSWSNSRECWSHALSLICHMVAINLRPCFLMLDLSFVHWMGMAMIHCCLDLLCSYNKRHVNICWSLNLVFTNNKGVVAKNILANVSCDWIKPKAMFFNTWTSYVHKMGMAIIWCC
jgi:hypothetical protein